MTTNNKDKDKSNENNKDLSFTSDAINTNQLFSGKISINIDKFIKLYTLQNGSKLELSFESGYGDKIDNKLFINKDVSAKLRLNSFLNKLNGIDKDISIYNLVRLENNTDKKDSEYDEEEISEDEDKDENLYNIEDKIFANEKLTKEEEKMLNEYIQQSNIVSRGLKKIGKTNYLILEDSYFDHSLKFIKLNNKGNIDCVLDSDEYENPIKPIKSVELAFYEDEADESTSENNNDEIPFVNIYTNYNNIFKKEIKLDIKAYQKKLNEGFTYSLYSFISKNNYQVDIKGVKILEDPSNSDLYKNLIDALNAETIIEIIK